MCALVLFVYRIVASEISVMRGKNHVKTQTLGTYNLTELTFFQSPSFPHPSLSPTIITSTPIYSLPEPSNTAPPHSLQTPSQPLAPHPAEPSIPQTWSLELCSSHIGKRADVLDSTRPYLPRHRHLQSEVVGEVSFHPIHRLSHMILDKVKSNGEGDGESCKYLPVQSTTERTKTIILSVTLFGEANHVPRSVSVYSPSRDAVSSAANGKEVYTWYQSEMGSAQGTWPRAVQMADSLILQADLS